MEIHQSDYTSINWFSKPSASYRTLNYNSFIPEHIKISNHINRYVKTLYLTHEKYLFDNVNKLINIDMRNKYPNRRIYNNIKHIIEHNKSNKNLMEVIFEFIIKEKIINNWNTEDNSFLIRQYSMHKGLAITQIEAWLNNRAQDKNIKIKEDGPHTLDAQSTCPHPNKHLLKSLFIIQYRGEDRNRMINNIFKRNNVDIVLSNRISLPKN